uniref:hypothetical protein n=1 Tax=Pseudonocardia sp. CA-138482 TaxID=3240023 RepID=UPI003F4913E1
MTASTPTAQTGKVPFAQYAEDMAGLAERKLRGRRREVEGKRFAYLANYYMREIVIAEFEVEFWTNAARDAKGGDDLGIRTLSEDIGRALCGHARSTDAFARAAGEALHDAAQLVLREARAYVDASALLARLATTSARSSGTWMSPSRPR